MNQANPPVVTDLHDAIMSLRCCSAPCNAGADPRQAYMEGYRDARHSAAELAKACALSIESRDGRRLEAFVTWFLRGGARSDVCPNDEVIPATREGVLAWLDAQLQPADAEQVSELVRILDDLCKDAKISNLTNGQVYRTAQTMIVKYSQPVYEGSPVSDLIQVIGDFLVMANLFRMKETPALVRAKSVFGGFCHPGR